MYTKKRKVAKNNPNINNFFIKSKQKPFKCDCISDTRFKKTANHYLDSMTQKGEDVFTHLLICLMTENKFNMTDEFIEITRKAFNSYTEDIFKVLEEMGNWGKNREKQRRIISSRIIIQCVEHLDSLSECVYE